MTTVDSVVGSPIAGESTTVWKRAGAHCPEEDDDDDDYDLDEMCESGVQLGTAVPWKREGSKCLFTNLDWHAWDGGKAGGWPIWLNPRDLPQPDSMRCGECNHPLSFLVQLYCPLDHEDDAFHRCVYVFCCPKAACSKNSSVKALRCQLPRSNIFYPYKPEDEEYLRNGPKNQGIPDKRRLGADPTAWGVSVCCVCGQLAKSACSRCKQARYCGREHQAQHWKSGGHKKACGAASASKSEAAVAGSNATLRPDPMGSVFREFIVDVRPEPPPPPVAPDGRTAEEILASQLDFGNADIDVNGSGVDEDGRLSQVELDKIAGVHGVKDMVTLRFLTRTHAIPQVVRYDAGGAGPLWSSSKCIPEEGSVPPCPRCGRARKFEFQVMPHLLHFLGTESGGEVWDKKAASREPGAPSHPLDMRDCMDWGTLAVYTCPSSCLIGAGQAVVPPDGSGSSAENAKGFHARVVEAYVEEFVWRQPPP